MNILCNFLIPSGGIIIRNNSNNVAWKRNSMLRRRPCNISVSLRNDWNVEEEELRACGVTVTGLGDSLVMRMALANGSSAAKLMLPSGLITSFKAEMWHGAAVELLHTTVDPAATNTIQGGLSLSLSLSLSSEGVSNEGWSPNGWSLHRVSGSPQDYIQVELINSSEEDRGVTRVKHIITLRRDYLTSQLLVSNLSTSSTLHLTGSALCHLTASTPEATYALGLEGSDFFIRAPLFADFSIIPPQFKETSAQGPSKFWPFSKLSRALEDDVESLSKDGAELDLLEEKDNYKHLTKRLTRIYTSAPRSLTIIDRGRRNSVTVERNGFKELYMFSPGSAHESYSKYSYICIGHAALLEPIILNPQSEWRGGLQLWNPNS